MFESNFAQLSILMNQPIKINMLIIVFKMLFYNLMNIMTCYKLIFFLFYWIKMYVLLVLLVK